MRIKIRPKLEDHFPLNIEEVTENPFDYDKGIYAPHPFYEGTVEYKGKNVVFTLQKHIPDDEASMELGMAIQRVALANQIYSLSKAEDALPGTKFDLSQEASEMFKELGLHEEFWGDEEISTANTLYNQFGSDAQIIVPGYEKGKYIRTDGKLITLVQRIPRRSRHKIKSLLRKKGLKGDVYFAGEI